MNARGDAAAPRRAPRWLLPTLAVLAAAVLAFALGRFSAFGAATAAPSTPDTHSAEAGFARDMQLHHAQAVDMAMEIHRKTDDAEVRMMAYDMATAQSAQIGEMYSWLVAWGLPQRGGPLMTWMGHGGAAHPQDADAGHAAGAGAGHDPGAGADADADADAMSDAELQAAMGMAAPEQLAALSAATGTEADCLFLELMLRHHVGGVEMVDAILELGSEPRVLAVAAAMGEVQRFEIDAMQSSLLRLGCSVR